MAYKRSRNTYEGASSAPEPTFAKYGTPLPSFDDQSRDDGSYVPVWKQEVVDERGRKRLHGAFTGGFSAGYFNSVGSKEGWTPSTFVSSRSDRRKDDTKQKSQRPEDFMDEEDMKEQEESQVLQTKDAFTSLGSTGDDAKRQSLLLGIFRPEGDTMGVKLLRKMGWRDGQGVGARIRRKARFDNEEEDAAAGDEHLFAPENTHTLTFTKKMDHKGLGYSGEESLETSKRITAQDDDDRDDLLDLGPVIKKAALKPRKGGIGIGVLNDLGSDDEDAYDVGPRISYNRVIGGDKKTAKKVQKPAILAPAANPLLKNKPVFLSKKATPARFRKCYDGRLPLPGFVLADPVESASTMPDDEKYPIPTIPVDWKSSKAKPSTTQKPYVSTADIAKASKLDPKARAALLSEAQLPGKSVFDYLSSSARDRVAAASGKANLPLGRGEAIPNTTTTTPSNSSINTSSYKPTTHDPNLIPDLDKSTALAALSRGIGGWTPYADNPSKSTRYRSFLSFRGGLIPALPPPLASSSKEDDLTPDVWLQELHEFAHAARVFKPMTGMMATRFTSSTAVPASASSAKNEDDSPDTAAPLLHTPSAKPKDPAEEAAKAGMFGPLTRSILPFAPTRLLCKRFGVRAPAQVQADGDGGVVSGAADRTRREPMAHTSAAPDLVSKEMMETLMREAGVEVPPPPPVVDEGHGMAETVVEQRVDVHKNEALEGKRAAEALFKSVFGDDSDDE